MRVWLHSKKASTSVLLGSTMQGGISSRRRTQQNVNCKRRTNVHLLGVQQYMSHRLEVHMHTQCPCLMPGAVRA